MQTTRTSPSARLWSSIVTGVDASLIATALGLMGALVSFSSLGPAALPYALGSVTIALVLGGLVGMVVSRDIVIVCGPTATGALIVAAMTDQLLRLEGAAVSLEVAVFATTVVTLGGGLIQLALARARLGAALKFIPYPVLMGFVNAVGVSLVVSVVPFALGHTGLGHLSQIATWFDDWRPASLLVATSGTVAGYVAVRWLPRAPSAFIALAFATATHHLIAAVAPAWALGPLLPFATIDPWPAYGRALAAPSLGIAGWGIVLQAALTVGVLNAVFSLLSTAFVVRDEGRPVDGNDLLAKLGTAGVASGLALGMPMAVITSASLVVRQTLGHHRVTNATYLIALALLFWCGGRLFALVPMAAVASSVFVIARTQYDVTTWPLIRQAMKGRAQRATTLGPLLVAALVVAVGAFRSLAAALSVGALAAVCLLAIEMRRNVVLGMQDGRARRSRHVRTAAERERLDALGDRIRVIELGHWLYFGTADEIALLVDQQCDARWVLLDARRIAGIDLTAAHSLVQAAERLHRKGGHLVLAGIRDDDPRRRALDALEDDAARAHLSIAPDIDFALERAEDDLLGATDETSGIADVTLPGLSSDEAARLATRFETCTFRAGERLFRAGDPGDALFLVRSGRVTLWAGQSPHARMRLLTFGAGGLFGEMALLDGRPRSADAQADTDCTLQALSRDAFVALARSDPALHARVLNVLALQLVGRLRETTVMLDHALR